MPRASREKKPAPARLLSEYRAKRDFRRTREPSGSAKPSTSSGVLRFVIQKHAASHLHFDLRLELDGVMKSWAVPKGPSLDPSVKRLAMQVEDHPIDYNSFEGTIPAGEYGGGTVMLWDRGTYSPDKAEAGSDPQSAVRDGLRRGDLKITIHGARLHGSFALVRMKFANGGRSEKPQWLLIKHKDSFSTNDDVVAANMTSVTTGRTMDEIASGASRVWRSNRTSGQKAAPVPRKPVRKSPSRKSRASEAAQTARITPGTFEPMYASVGSAIPAGNWTFEPKWDGVRILAFATRDDVQLITRNGKNKAAQFPEIVEALKKLVRGTRRPLVLDGEIVALLEGNPARFQELQGRMHVRERELIEHRSAGSPAALMLFDILMDGDDVLIHEPWAARRGILVKRVGNRVNDRIRITESIESRGGQMLDRARREGWEGVIAKRVDSKYEPGTRSKSWLKLKIEFRQEFVVGGYTEPRNSREHIGAILLGYFEGNRLVYVGHTGGGFTRAGLSAIYRKLWPLEQKTCPFAPVPRTNEKAHWVKPKIVVEVKFNEWTADRRLRQPIFLGVRDDKAASEVRLEKKSVQVKKSPAIHAAGRKTASVKAAPPRTRPAPRSGSPLEERLREIEESGGDGLLTIARGKSLELSSLGKLFFPKDKVSKGDLLRYYVSVAPLILPAIADRPLVLKRFPNGIEGKSFFQQSPGEGVPQNVRIEPIISDAGAKQLRFVGGDLLTLLYTIQIGSISVDPWHSRVSNLEYADYTIIDLDPAPRAGFARVAEVARMCLEVLRDLKLSAALKTSGSRGLHIYIPLPRQTPTEAATLISQLVATRVAEQHPKQATVERSVSSRGPTTVYVDYLQNIKGKTIASAYCVRAKTGAMVSTPIEWDELDDALDPRDFTLRTVGDRFARIGDIWARQMKKGNSLKTLLALGLG